MNIRTVLRRCRWILWAPMSLSLLLLLSCHRVSSGNTDTLQGRSDYSSERSEFAQGADYPSRADYNYFYSVSQSPAAPPPPIPPASKPASPAKPQPQRTKPLSNSEALP